MSTLLLRLAAPLQSWGASGKFNRRGTESAPTKSGVVGLCAAALGKRRDEDIRELAELKFGVRVDQPGQLLADYHIARTEAACKADAGQQAKNAGTFLSTRYYLADAVFLAGLEGDAGLLHEIDAALRNPVFPLFLGRRACPPTLPLSLGVKSDVSLAEALALHNQPWLASSWWRRKQARINHGRQIFLETALDDAMGDGAVFSLHDTPVTFDQQRRIHAYRAVRREHILLAAAGSDAPTRHDPFTALEDE
jgi:CRISPR system Cascade subunit CasD